MASIEAARVEPPPDSPSSEGYDEYGNPVDDVESEQESDSAGHRDPFANADVVSSVSDSEVMPSTLPPQPAPTAVRTDPRGKMSRSATAQSPSTATSSANPHRPRRTMSEDSSQAARPANKGTKGPNAAPPAKDKPSQHADIIDKLDISGVGGGMFHHDGPFDACAPSRNKTAKPHRAPMYAFDAGNNGAPHNVPVMDKRLSPLAQATIAAMASSDGPYPSASLMPMPASDSLGDPMPRGMQNGRLGPSTRKMTLTEAWGRGEPEPFEEFSAGTIGQNGAHSSARSSLDGDLGSYETYQRRQERGNVGRRGESLDIPTRRQTKLPPPQPIILPGARSPGPDSNTSPGPGETSPTYASDASPTKPKVQRTKSLMQRFRKMRENPNVPVGGGAAVDAGYYSEGPYSPREGGWTPGPKTTAVPEEPEPSEKPALPRSYSHVRGPSRDHGLRQSYKPRSPRSPDEPFVVVNNAVAVAASREKALPAPPSSYPAETDNGYFDRTGGGGAEFGRKTSLYRKVKGVVAGGKGK